MINFFLTVFKLHFPFLDHLVLLNILFPPLSQSQSYPSILCLISNPSSIYCMLSSFKLPFFQTTILSDTLVIKDPLPPFYATTLLFDHLIFGHPSIRLLIYSTTLFFDHPSIRPHFNSATLLFNHTSIRPPFYLTNLLFDHTSILPTFYSTTLLFDHTSI